MPDRLILVAAMDAHTGFGQHALALINGLSRRFHVLVRPTKVNDKIAKLPTSVRARFVHGIQPEESEILLHYPDFLPTPGKNTAYLTTWESTRLPRQCVDMLNRAKVVIVPCEWNASCFSASGVEAPIRVVPLGIDPAVFMHQPFPERPFTFGCGGRLGNGQNRKGIASIIRLFQVAFDKQDVRLKIKCSPDDPIEQPADKRIELNKEYLPDHKLAEWYASLHCYVSFATGSWELMPHQAMAVGRPVMGIRFAGMAEYLSEQASFILPHTLVPAHDRWHGHGHWAKPEDSDVVEMMRFMAGKDMQAKGWESHIAAINLSWDNSVQKLMAVLEEYQLIPRPQPTPSQKRKCFVQLGRYGDIINILPILREDYRITGMKPVLMVAEEYADVLNGVSYADPYPWHGPFTDINPAVAHAQTIYPEVIATQVYGKDYAITRGESFNLDAWRLAGIRERDLPLVFDRRDFERENALADVIFDNDKVNVALCLSGISSPFQHAKELLSVLNDLPVNIIDLSNFKAHAIYDILGVFDRVNLIICSDSAPLHLAAATNTPVIALVADTPTLWHGTTPRCNLLARMRYRAVPDQLQAIREMVSTAPTGPRLLHVYSDFLVDGDTHRRNELARRTWATVYAQGRWVKCAVSDQSLPRLFPDNRRKLPFLKDMIDQGVLRSVSDNEVIVLTNADSCLSAATTTETLRALESMNAAFCYRQDFNHLSEPLSVGEIAKGTPYPGCDFFAFKAGWWKTNRNKMPDMVIGAEAFDWVLRELIRTTDGGQVSNLVYHERHSTLWEANRFTMASQKHNHALAKPFLKSLGVYSGEFDR